MLDGAPPTPPARKPTGPAWAAGVVALLLLTAWLLGSGHGSGRGPVPGAGPSGASAAVRVDPAAGPGRSSGQDGAAATPAHPAHAPLVAADPVRLDIASLGVHAPVVPRGLTDGTVDPPPYSTPGTAGWYRGGPSPGAAGAALIVGHVDTETGPAVFYQLSTVRPGARVEVTRADGTVAEFTVAAVDTVEKAHFDPSRVYGSPTGPPELRLVTCGGVFDRTTRAYTANIVIRAPLTGSHRA